MSLTFAPAAPSADVVVSFLENDRPGVAASAVEEPCTGLVRDENCPYCWGPETD